MPDKDEPNHRMATKVIPKTALVFKERLPVNLQMRKIQLGVTEIYVFYNYHICHKN